VIKVVAGISSAQASEEEKAAGRISIALLDYIILCHSQAIKQLTYYPAGTTLSSTKFYISAIKQMVN
jgi:hypothetical protein